MNNYKQKRKLETIIALCMLFFVGVVIFSVCSFVALGKARRKNAEYDKLIASLKQEQSSLENNIDYINSNEYLESQARGHFGMIKEGEKLYIFE